MANSFVVLEVMVCQLWIAAKSRAALKRAEGINLVQRIMRFPAQGIDETLQNDLIGQSVRCFFLCIQGASVILIPIIKGAIGAL